MVLSLNYLDFSSLVKEGRMKMRTLPCFSSGEVGSAEWKTIAKLFSRNHRMCNRPKMRCLLRPLLALDIDGARSEVLPLIKAHLF